MSYYRTVRARAYRPGCDGLAYRASGDEFTVRISPDHPPANWFEIVRDATEAETAQLTKLLGDPREPVAMSQMTQPQHRVGDGVNDPLPKVNE